MLAHFENDVQIAGRPAIRTRIAFLRQPQPRAVIHAGRDVDLQLAVHLAVTFPRAHRAPLLDDLPRAVALPARAADGKNALLIENLAAAAAGGTHRRAGSGLGATAFAVPAGFQPRRLNLGRQPEYGVFEVDLQVVTQILAALRTVAPPSPRLSAKQVAEAEELAQDVAEIGELIGIESAAGSLHCLMPKAVVGGPLLRIAEDTVSLSRFLEALLGVLVVQFWSGMVYSIRLGRR